MRPAQITALKAIYRNPETSFLSWEKTSVDRDGAIINGVTGRVLTDRGFTELHELRAGMVQITLTERGRRAADPDNYNCNHLPLVATYEEAETQLDHNKRYRMSGDPNYSSIQFCPTHRGYHLSVLQVQLDFADA